MKRNMTTLMTLNEKTKMMIYSQTLAEEMSTNSLNNKELDSSTTILMTISWTKTMTKRISLGSSLRVYLRNPWTKLQAPDKEKSYLTCKGIQIKKSNMITSQKPKMKTKMLTITNTIMCLMTLKWKTKMKKKCQMKKKRKKGTLICSKNYSSNLIEKTNKIIIANEYR